MPGPKRNYAFIDSQNLNLAIKDQGWKLDFGRFRTYLEDKYNVEKAFVFIGFDPENEQLYSSLQKDGYILIFKPTLKLPDGGMKGNVDAELVMYTMMELNNFEKAVIVTGDGDFYCLVEYLKVKGKLEKLLIPNQFRYSSLLRPFAEEDVAFMNGLRSKMSYKNRPKKTKEGTEVAAAPEAPAPVVKKPEAPLIAPPQKKPQQGRRQRQPRQQQPRQAQRPQAAQQPKQQQQQRRPQPQRQASPQAPKPRQQQQPRRQPQQQQRRPQKPQQQQAQPQKPGQPQQPGQGRGRRRGRRRR